VERVILFLVAAALMFVVPVFAHLLTADFACPLCGHLNAEHWRWMVIARRCRTCNRWCRIWMG
jgi:hypothetical protein